MYNTIYGNAHLNKIDFVHGDFSPKWIVKTTTGYAVLDNPLRNQSYPIELNGEESIFLSPEAYTAALYQKDPSEAYDISKSDVFSCGLVLLSAGILQSMDSLYKNSKIDRSKLLEKLMKLKENYPENVLLLGTLDRMLDFNPHTRPSFNRVKKVLPEFHIVQQYFHNFSDTLTKEEIINEVPQDITFNGPQNIQL